VCDEFAASCSTDIPCWQSQHLSGRLSCSNARNSTVRIVLHALSACLAVIGSFETPSHLKTVFPLPWYTHTHTRLTALCPGLPGWASTRKVKPVWILLLARDSKWQQHHLGHMQVCTSLQTDNHASSPPLSFFTGRMPFLPPNQQRQSTEGTTLILGVKWIPNSWVLNELVPSLVPRHKTAERRQVDTMPYHCAHYFTSCYVMTGSCQCSCVSVLTVVVHCLMKRRCSLSVFYRCLSCYSLCT